MSRVPRRFQLGDAVCFHVMDRGHDRETIFVDDVDRLAFLELLGRYREEFNFQLFHYSLIAT